MQRDVGGVAPASCCGTQGLALQGDDTGPHGHRDVVAAVALGENSAHAGGDGGVRCTVVLKRNGSVRLRQCRHLPQRRRGEKGYDQAERKAHGT